MKVYQIYFDPAHVDQLEPEFHWYPNEACTVYFENSVIRKLVEDDAHKNAFYFGVVSYQLRSKIGFTKENWKNNPNIHNKSTQEFTPTEFKRQLYQGMPDAMSFQRHVGHDTVLTAEGFHPGFMKHWKEVMSRIGYFWEPTRIENIFYCNYFVARTDLYERYVKEMLAPAMDVMDTMEQLWEPCRYPKPLPEALRKRFAVDHYTFHAFLCERMFSYFAHIHNLKCLHY